MRKTAALLTFIFIFTLSIGVSYSGRLPEPGGETEILPKQDGIGYLTLNYRATDTIRRATEEVVHRDSEPWENVYTVDVSDYSLEVLQEDGRGRADVVKVELDIETTDLGDIVRDKDLSLEEKADRINDRNYTYEGDNFTVDVVEDLEEELEDLSFEITRGTKEDGLERPINVKNGKASVRFSVNTEIGSGPLAMWRLGEQSIEFTLEQTIDEPGRDVQGLAFADEGEVLAVVEGEYDDGADDGDGTLHIYSMGSHYQLVETVDLGSSPSGSNEYSLEFSPDEQYLSMGLWGPGGVHIYETSDWTLEQELAPDGTDVLYYSSSWSPDGELLALGTSDENLYIYNTSDWTIEEDIEKDGVPRGIGFSHEGDMFVSGCTEGNIVVMETDDWTVSESWSIGDSVIAHTLFSETDEYMTVGTWDNELYIYETDNLGEGQHVYYEDVDGSVYGVDWFGRDDYITYGQGAGASAPYSVYVRESGTWDLVQTFDDAGDVVESVRASGGTVATGSRDTDVRIYSSEPEVTTKLAHDISLGAATLRGELEDMGGVDELNLTFQWREQGDEDWEEILVEEDVTETMEFEHRLEGLDNHTDYEFYAAAEGLLDGEGETLPFSTVEQISWKTEEDWDDYEEARSMNVVGDQIELGETAERGVDFNDVEETYEGEPNQWETHWEVTDVDVVSMDTMELTYDYELEGYQHGAQPNSPAGVRVMVGQEEIMEVMTEDENYGREVWEDEVDVSDDDTVDLEFQYYTEEDHGESSVTVYNASYEYMEDLYYGDGNLLTGLKSMVSVRPNLEDMVYHRNGQAITLDVIGSPGRAREERLEGIELDGQDEEELDWEREHSYFQVNVTMESLDGETVPVFENLTLKRGIVVSTRSPENVTHESAVLRGELVYMDPGHEEVDLYFYWREKGEEEWEEVLVEEDVTETTTYNYTLDGLDDTSEYEYYAYGICPEHDIYDSGSTLAFTTDAPPGVWWVHDQYQWESATGEHNFTYVENGTLHFEGTEEEPVDAGEYCYIDGDSSYGEYITNVNIHGIDRDSGNDGGYADHTDSITDAMVPGETYEISVDYEDDDGWGYAHLEVWFDWEQDYTWDDGQQVDHEDSGTTNTLSGPITVPEDVEPGSTGMRVILRTDSEEGGYLNDPCAGDYSFGETEDYTVLVGSNAGSWSSVVWETGLGTNTFVDSFETEVVKEENENVEVRLGVDTKNDGSIEEWSSWEGLDDGYNYFDGDVFGLSEGYHYQVEYSFEGNNPSVENYTLTTDMPDLVVHGLQCLKDGENWVDCEQLTDFDSEFTATRVECTSEETDTIQKTNISIATEYDDVYRFKDENYTYGDGDWYIYDHTTQTVDDSGWWNASASCYDGTEWSAEHVERWHVGWGQLQVEMHSPVPNETTEILQNRTFTMDATVTCSGGECSSEGEEVMAWADPYEVGDNENDLEGGEEDLLSEPDSFYEVNVKGNVFDVRDGLPETDLDPPEYVEGEEGLYLVRMTGPIQPHWRQGLEDIGVEIINYQPNHLYEVRMTPEQRDQVEDLPYVFWVDIYPPDFRLQEDISPGILVSDAVGRDDLFWIEDVAPQAEVIVSKNIGPRKARGLVDVPNMNAIESIAEEHDIYYLSEFVESELYGEMATQITGGGLWIWDPEEDPDSPFRDGTLSDSQYAGEAGSFATQLGYTGENVTIAVADTGIGDGTVGDAGHPDFTGRVIGGYDFETDSAQEGNWADGHGHGTTVTGVAAADTYHGTGDFYYNDYYAAQGTAPLSDLFAVRVFDDGGNWIGPEPGDYGEIIEISRQYSNPYIHTSSFGAGDDGAYDDRSSEYDSVVRDAGDGEPIVLTVASGTTDGIGYNSINRPGTAKNVITVGATLNYNPEDGVSDPEAVSDASHRGWTDDNRVKPDVMAPGEEIRSTDLGGGYTTSSGTSFSTPNVAGSVSVVVEWYEEKFGEKPSPAMVKALLVNTAYSLENTQDMTGENTPHIPNQDEGWGMVNLHGLIASPVEFDSVDGVSSLQTDDVDEYTMYYENSSHPLKITLTWTDVEAQPGDEMTLKNNLDLEVVSPGGDVYRGNNLVESWSEPGESTYSTFDTTDDGWDDVNNVQNVFIHEEDLEDGVYTIHVHGTEVPEDGTGDGELTQDYSLVLQNSEDREKEIIEPCPAEPFCLEEGGNPQTMMNMQPGDEIYFEGTVNATGDTGNYTAFFFANTTNPYVFEEQSDYATVEITDDKEIWIEITPSQGIQDGIDFGNIAPGTEDNDALGNQGGSGTDYGISVGDATNVEVDLYHYAEEGGLSSSEDFISAENVIHQANTTDPDGSNLVPEDSVAFNVTDYSLIGDGVCSGLGPGDDCWIRYWMDVPEVQTTGDYDTTYHYCAVGKGSGGDACGT